MSGGGVLAARRMAGSPSLMCYCSSAEGFTIMSQPSMRVTGGKKLMQNGVIILVHINICAHAHKGTQTQSECG